MAISSGSPNRCPVCGNAVRIEPSLFGEATCPCCGHLLWFLVLKGKPHFFLPEEKAELRERIFARICENLGVNKDALPADSLFGSETGLDSLDLAELVMELEEDFE
jgi:acyl carrier protein